MYYRNARETIENVKKRNGSIIVYGLGKMWSKIGEEIMEHMRIVPDYYCDQDMLVLGEATVPENKKITLEKLIKEEKRALILFFLSIKYFDEFLRQFSDNAFLDIITINDLFDDDLLIKDFFGLDFIPTRVLGTTNKGIPQDGSDNKCSKSISSKRIAVYTCITAGYDSLNIPVNKENNCSYFFITEQDNLKKASSFYTSINVDEVVPKTIENPIDKNRYCKMNGHIIFKEYDYSIYVDGNIQIVGDITKLLNNLNEYGIGFHTHPYAQDPYMESLFIAANGKSSRKELTAFLTEIAYDGLPRHYGCVECGVIVRENQNEIANKITEKWFENYMKNGTRRDQLAIIQTLFQMGISVEMVERYRCNLRKNGVTRITDMH